MPNPPDMLTNPALPWHVSQIDEKLQVRGPSGGPLLMTGSTWQFRTQVLHAAAEQIGLYYLALSLPLAQAMQDISVRRRPFALEETVRRLIKPPRKQPWQGCALDQIEVLFLPELKTNVYGFLQRLCQDQTLVVSWPGHYRSGRLEYASPGHAEHQSQRVGSIPCIRIED